MHDDPKPPTLKPQWSLTKSLLLRPFRPATSAANTQTLSLGHAYLVHMIVALAGLVIGITGETLLYTPRFYGWGDFTDCVIRGYVEFVMSVRENPYLTLLAVASIEALCLSLAVIAAPWGARDEPLRSSFAHSLRHTWIHTTHIALVGLFCALVVGLDDTAIRPTRNAVPAYRSGPIAPAVPPLQRATSPEWKEYEREMALWWSVYQSETARMRLTQPWWIRHSDWLVFDVCLALSLWALWTLLRAVGTERRVPTIPRPPMCDACGYNLTGLPDDSRCPECGLPMLDSLGPHVRRGTAWERNRRAKLRSSWLTTAVAAVRRPTELARQLSLTEHAADHRWFYVRSVFWIFLIALTGITLSVLSTSNWRLDAAFLFILPILATFYTAAAFAVQMLLTMLIALKIGASCKRNLLPAAAQIFCYLSPWIVMGTACAGTTGLIAIEIERTNLIREVAGRNDEAVLFTIWILLNAPWLIAYLVLTARALRATRYANR